MKEIPEYQKSYSWQRTFEGNGDLIKKLTCLIRSIMQSEELYKKELIRTHQVTPSQLICLRALYETGPLSLSRLAGLIMVKPSTVTGIIDRLEKKGLVERHRRAADRRLVTVDLTPAGKGFSLNAPPPISQKMVDAITKLSKSEMEKMLVSLNILVRILDS